jgi:predicted homoserine dehydrogenase-like protein
VNLYRLARERAATGRPVRVGLIGAGKFGSMFLNQVPSMAGIEVAVIADLDPERARGACRTVGWDAARIAHQVPLSQDIAAGNIVRWADVAVRDGEALTARRDMARRFAPPPAIAAQ